MTTTTDKKMLAWESIVRTIASVLMTGLLSWMCITLVSLGSDVAVIKVQLPAIIEAGERVNALSERMALVEFQLYNKGGKE